MSTASMKLTMVRLGGFGALIGVTVLLTLLFSILGNITCAVVAGLIFGAGKRWQWQALPCSLVFPGLLLLLSYYSKVELPGQKLSLVALLSGGAFWSVFGLAFLLRFVERKPEGPQAGLRDGDAVSDSTTTPAGFGVATLRGNWTCDEPGQGMILSRTLRIEEGKFQLTERTRRGRERIVARGAVSIGPARPGEIIFTNQPTQESNPRGRDA